MGIFGNNSHRSQKVQSGNMSQKRQFKKEKKVRSTKLIDENSEERNLCPEKFGDEVNVSTIYGKKPRDWKTGELIKSPNDNSEGPQIMQDFENWRLKFIAETRAASKSRNEGLSAFTLNRAKKA